MEDPHVFKTDKKTIDTQKVTFSIWKNRENAEYVKDFTEILRYHNVQYISLAFKPFSIWTIY